MASAKWRPSCLGLNVLMHNIDFSIPLAVHVFIYPDDVTCSLFWYETFAHIIKAKLFGHVQAYL